jgi:hypothetical protein
MHTESCWENIHMEDQGGDVIKMISDTFQLHLSSVSPLLTMF